MEIPIWESTSRLLRSCPEDYGSVFSKSLSATVLCFSPMNESIPITVIGVASDWIGGVMKRHGSSVRRRI